jgi:hypothetical protein
VYIVANQANLLARSADRYQSKFIELTQARGISYSSTDKAYQRLKYTKNAKPVMMYEYETWFVTEKG